MATCLAEMVCGLLLDAHGTHAEAFTQRVMTRLAAATARVSAVCGPNATVRFAAAVDATVRHSDVLSAVPLTPDACAGSMHTIAAVAAAAACVSSLGLKRLAARSVIQQWWSGRMGVQVWTTHMSMVFSERRCRCRWM